MLRYLTLWHSLEFSYPRQFGIFPEQDIGTWPSCHCHRPWPRRAVTLVCPPNGLRSHTRWLADGQQLARPWTEFKLAGKGSSSVFNSSFNQVVGPGATLFVHCSGNYLSATGSFHAHNHKVGFKLVRRRWDRCGPARGSLPIIQNRNDLEPPESTTWHLSYKDRDRCQAQSKPFSSELFHYQAARYPPCHPSFPQIPLFWFCLFIPIPVTFVPTISNMRTSTAAALLAAAGANIVSAQDKVDFGPAFSLGPNQSWIREANTTLVLPPVPSPQKDRLALWPGMGTSGGDLIQALAVSFSDPAANCGAKAGQWCTWASTLQGKPPNFGGQRMELGY